MTNLILIIIEIIICYLLMYIIIKKYDDLGIYIYAVIVTIAACIMTLKKISIFGVNIPTGFGLTTSLIVSSNLITQRKGKEELKKYLAIIFLSGIIGFSFLNLSGLLESSKYNYIANESYNNIFIYSIRIYIALIVSLIFSIWTSNRIFYLIKRIYNKIVISNILSIIIVELIENIIFVLIAYLFEYSYIDIILCIVLRYIIKIIIGIIGTIPLYMLNKYSK